MYLLPEGVALPTLRMTPDQLATAVERGEIECVEVRGEALFTLHSVRRYLASHPKQPKEKPNALASEDTSG